MLEKIDLTKDMGKQEAKQLLNGLNVELSRLQREARALNIPVMVIFEGWGAAGKGTLINRLILPLDPRGFKVFTIQKPTEDEAMHPFLWRFWTKTPAKGRIHIFDRSWYDKVLRERIDTGLHEEGKGDAYQDIVSFEETLSLDGTLIIKFFLHISKKEQKKRFEKLEESPETRWRVTKEDWKHHKQYDEYLKAYEDILEKTDTDFAPWTIVEATDREYAAVKILTCVAERLKEKIAECGRAKLEGKAEDLKTAVAGDQLRTSVLSQVKLDKCYEKEEYKKRLKALQGRLEILHSELYRKRIPVVLAFEGWDAGGKGGAIKRLTEKMDPRGYEVIPTASPNDLEKAHHYLWRFWRAMPKDGHVAIFDRTWYGRVMVERIEGFCTTQEWKRAYKEINEMEAQLANAGAVIIKFWMQIDKDEQEKRFHERMDNPDKNWKITDEDWRNREKWDQYEEAVDEMLIRTSTACAPWVVVEGNCKYYARIKVLETFVEALEKRLKEQ
ncbi:phosphate--AMP phosphotransferase [Clostridium sp. MCC353]|uniref:phosphate--AMP phosphotransferase n=1 Tax=Clostridium sp. MCC353 TaxID=2592646 RepID=UPI001C0378F1|nr:phosphate--AMP phosphotransferase [Clostridium sp. MCC353]MBT9779923.1 phosphate--AMP phosphotransferase [Clostridium sp. MCC353]